MRACAAVLCLLLATGLPAGEPERPAITPTDAAGLARNLQGRVGKVVLVNFWATWCRPCLNEIPALMSLADEYRDQGFELVAVSLDSAEELDTLVAPFLRKWFPEFTTYISLERDMDSMVSVIDPYWNEVLPTSYLLARDGSVARRVQGGSDVEEFAAHIRPLL